MKYFIGFLLLTLSATGGYSQTSAKDPVDFLGWYGTSLTLDLKNKWEVGIDYQARFQNNLASYKGSYISFSGSKRVHKRVGIQAEYRLGLVRGNSTFHRFSVGGEFEPKVAKVDLAFRLLFLNNIQDFLDPADASTRDLFWRARMKVGLPLQKKWVAYLAIEPVMKFGGNRFVDNLRNTIGVKHKLSKTTRLDLYYMFRPDYAKATYNRTFHVVGLNLDFRTSASKKKK
ncbi:MAG: DUF2490 domain-containing protein [Sphingomonadales bacterium]